MAGRTPVGKAASPIAAQPTTLTPIEIMRGAASSAASAFGDFLNPSDAKIQKDFSGFPGGSKIDPPTPAKTAATQSAAPVQDNVFTNADSDRVRQLLLDSKNYLPNMLNDFLNPTYHIKFFVADIDFYRSNLGSGEELTFKKAISTMDQTPKIIIAETGVTGALNITDLTFMHSMYKHGDANAALDSNSWKMTIREPMGTLLYDSMRNAIIKIGGKTLSDYPHFVEISFKGYDIDGSLNTNLLPAMSNGGRFLYRLQLTTIDTKMDEGGTVHNLSMSPVAFIGLEGESATAQAMIHIEASTVGEFFQKLQEQLTKAQDTRYGTNATTGHYNEYAFTFKNINNDDPTKWSIKPKEADKNPSNMLSFENGKPTFNIPPGTSIEDIVNVVFANTEQAQQYANALPITNETEESKDKTNSQRFKNAIIMRVHPIVTETKFHPVAQKYMRKIEYIVMGFKSQAAITSPRQVEDSKDSTVQVKMIDALFKDGFLKKRYDYLYTGLNTEVLSLDMTVSLNWTSVLPDLLGYRLNGPMLSQHDKYNAVVTAREAQNGVMKASDDLEKAKSDLKTAESNHASTSDIRDKKKLVSTLQETLATNQSFAQTTMGAIFKQQDSNPRHNSVSAQELIFAETLTSTPTYDQVDSDIGITQQPAGVDMDRGKGMATQYHRDRGIYGAIWDQISLSTSGSLQNLEMEIRGDPFWMSRGGVENEAYKNPTVPDPKEHDLAAYLEGDNSFLLYVAYPSGVGEDGSPIFATFEDGDRKDAFSSIYRVMKVTNKFEGGSFTQTLAADKIPLISLAGALGFNKAQSELTGSIQDATFETVGGDKGTFTPGGQSKSTGTVSGAQRQKYMQVAYNQFIANGYTPEAARTMVAEIGRENNFNSNTLFGTHTDAANGKTNAGIFSYQKSRKIALDSYMKNLGLVNTDGTYVQSDHSLQAQVNFATHEIQTNPQFAQTKNAVIDPNLSYNSLEPIISTNYVSWDRAGNSKAFKNNPSALQNAFDTQKRYYNTITSITKGS
jgi:hypothetical protein